MFTAVLFTVAKRLKQYKCALIDELINKMSYTHTMENNCTLKRRTFWHMLQHGWTLRAFATWIKSVTKWQILFDSTYIRYLELSNSWKQKIEWWLPGVEARKIRDFLFNGYRVSSLRRWKSSGNGRLGWLYNNVNVLKNIKMVNFMLCVLYHN